MNDFHHIFDKAFSDVTPVSDPETVFRKVKERSEKMKKFEFKDGGHITIAEPLPEKKPSKAPRIAAAALAVVVCAGAGGAAAYYLSNFAAAPDIDVTPSASSLSAVTTAPAESSVEYTTAVMGAEQVTDSYYTTDVHETIEYENCTLTVHDYFFDGMTLKLHYSVTTDENEPDDVQIMPWEEQGSKSMRLPIEDITGEDAAPRTREYECVFYSFVPVDKYDVFFWNTGLTNDENNAARAEQRNTVTAVNHASAITKTPDLVIATDGETYSKLTELYICPKTIGLRFKYTGTYDMYQMMRSERDADIRIVMSDGSEVKLTAQEKYAPYGGRPTYTDEDSSDGYKSIFVADEFEDTVITSNIRSVYVNESIVYGIPESNIVSYQSSAVEELIRFSDFTAKITSMDFDGRALNVRYEIVDRGTDEITMDKKLSQYFVLADDPHIGINSISILDADYSKYSLKATVDIPAGETLVLQYLYRHFDHEINDAVSEMSGQLVLMGLGESEYIRKIHPDPVFFTVDPVYADNPAYADNIIISPHCVEFDFIFDNEISYNTIQFNPSSVVMQYISSYTFNLSKYIFNGSITDSKTAHFTIFVDDASIDVTKLSYMWINGQAIEIPQPMNSVGFDPAPITTTAVITSAPELTTAITTVTYPSSDTTIPPNAEEGGLVGTADTRGNSCLPDIVREHTVSFQDTIWGESAYSALEDTSIYDFDRPNFRFPMDEKFKEELEYNGTFSIPTVEEEPVYAPFDGTVEGAEYLPGYGISVLLRDKYGEYWHFYSLSDKAVNEGDTVELGQLLGHTGTTGYTSKRKLGLMIYWDGLMPGESSGEEALEKLKEYAGADCSYPLADVNIDTLTYQAPRDTFGMPAKEGEDVFAVIGGTVTAVVAENEPGQRSGRYVEVQSPDGRIWRYTHCSEIVCSIGDNVNTGDVIAFAGSTGWCTGSMLGISLY